jgi:uncharacterized membrane protein YidH (DUF202 family)
LQHACQRVYVRAAKRLAQVLLSDYPPRRARELALLRAQRGGLPRRSATRKAGVKEGPMKLIAIVLIVLGVIGLVAGGISWTQREKVVDLGPVEVTRENRESIPVPPIVGGLLLLAGVVLLVASGRKTSP